MIDAIEGLPGQLRERTRALSEPMHAEGEFILYWMRNAVRTDENPALDVAIELANRSSQPLLVYQALSQHYRFASDRHHTFILQGAADVQRQFSSLGISYGFHLATPDDENQHLVALADQAVVVVTEEMPVDPARRFLKALRHKTPTPIVCVDTACVVPMQMTRKAYTRAFQFRKATETLYENRIRLPWPELAKKVRSYDISQLPFQPICFDDESIEKLVAKCEIDHSVGPVVDTIGGSDAGYRRWQRFLRTGIPGYASKRNNALVDGVSRMSAYLHYGMVSPMRLARDTASVSGSGAEKYLDELLTWRELAYHFCFHRDDHDQWSSIPQWAQKTLADHQHDPRPAIYSLEQLARAKTTDALWNAAQNSLLMQGELHNNVRMTWGKGILNWTPNGQTALNVMIDLNHRYALDGRDPASYGGLLWCLGQFDRPFKPEQPIVGTVRPRPTREHAKRLDVQRYAARVSAPRFSPEPKIGIIGAGISGVIAARTLLDHGVDVTLFEKSRHVGGRMSTRRRKGLPNFDHGAQYFTARDERFARHVRSWLHQGVVARWPDGESSIVVIKNGDVKPKSDSIERYVGVPGMRSVVEHLAEDVSVRFRTTIARITLDSHDRWQLVDQDGNSHGPFDQVLISSPAPQAVTLLKTVATRAGFDGLLRRVDAIQMNPSWATMACLESPIQIEPSWSGAFVHDSILSWVARDSSKPERKLATGEQLVLHGTAEWSKENLERDPEDIAREMLAEFWKVSGIVPRTPSHLEAHRWRYAIPVEPATERSLFSDDLSIGCCGDWLGGPRVEGAFLSGMAAAGRILGSLAGCDRLQSRSNQQQWFV